MAATTAKRTTLPAVTSNILDYGLGISPEPTSLNDSILIIGTASDGPKYEPIPILNKDQAELIFGSFGDGTLVRGIFEAFDATIEGTPDIKGLRIGNGSKAELEIAERVSTSHASDAVSTNWHSLKLEALYEGAKYNAISIYIDEQNKVNIYNPKTGTVSKFTYDDRNPNNTVVDARNVRELVDAINNDENLNAILVASTSGIPASFEIEANSSDTGVSVLNGKTILDMKTILSLYPTGLINPTGYIYDPDASTTAGNLIDTLEDVFSISVSNPELLEIKGLTSTKVTLTPLDGKGDSRLDTIQALEDYDANNRYQHNPTGSVVSEYVSYLDREVFTNVTVSEGIGSFNDTLSVVGLFEAPDDSQEVKVLSSGGLALTAKANDYSAYTTPAAVTNSCLALAWANAYSGVYVPAGYVAHNVSGLATTISQYVKITASGISSYLEYPGKIIIEVSKTNGTSDSDWTQLLYHPISGIYISGFACTNGTGVITLGIGGQAFQYSGYSDSLVDAGLISGVAGSVLVVPDNYIRISCTTCKGFLSEVDSLPALEAVTTNWKSYFFRGEEVVFADTVPTDIIVNYGTKITYEPGSDIVISDAANGELKFEGSIQPGPGGAALDSSKRSIIGLSYLHLPQFPAITTTAQSLAGGIDGIKPTNATLYSELQKAYDNLENYSVQIVVPMGAYLDATKDSYNSITGLPETVNAQFQVQLHEFMEQLSINVNEGIAIIGVEPAKNTTLASVSDWVKRLTVQDLNDPTRGANIMPLLDSKYVNVAAFEPVFDNLGGIPYTANGAAAYAGMISSLVPHQAPTNKSIPNAIRTRFNLSNSQLEALQAARYVAMRQKPGKNPVISSAVTAAAAGSDFERLTTVRITFAAMDVVRKVCDPFIGQPNNQNKRNAMEAAITKGLQNMVEQGALRKYNFTLTSSAEQQVSGIIEVDLILVPVFEIRQIRVTVKLRTDIPTTA